MTNRLPYLPWTPEQVETLKTMYAAGHSASQIAKAIGAPSRNSVIGKAHRLGLTKPTPPSDPARGVPRIPARGDKTRSNFATPRATRPKKALPDRSITSFRPSIVPQQDRPAPTDTRRAFLPLTNQTPVPVEDVSTSHCRWPVDCSDGQTRLCGAHRAGEARYCATHHAMAFRPAQERSAAQVRADIKRRAQWISRLAARHG